MFPTSVPFSISSAQDYLHFIRLPTQPDVNTLVEPSDLITNQPLPQTLQQPLCRVPTEILVEILSCCVRIDPDAPLLLSRVCRLWREIVHSWSTLWECLSLDASTSTIQRLSAKAEVWLSMSRSQPMDFQLKFDDPEHFLPLLSYVSPASNRWREGTITGPGAGRLAPFLGRKSLEALQITVSVPMEDDEVQVNSFKFDSKRDFPCLDIEIPSLPSPAFIAPFQSLKRLIVSRDDMVFPTTHSVLSFLSVCPSLEVLQFDHGWAEDVKPVEECQALPVTVLQNLRSLTLNAVFNTRCFLSHIITPNLEELHLTHVNSSSPFDISRWGEPGDSEDEANDYSESSWTDHATGMGLRKLFSRCDPPLRVLDMNYADLRTKDFKWALGRFRQLESLRIVASDMSDKVAKAFEPKSDLSWCPLPRLSNLELCNCQKLSGAAIERMLLRRIEAATQGQIARLQSLKVVRCAGFSDSHYVSVANSFRPRSGFSYTAYNNNV